MSAPLGENVAAMNTITLSISGMTGEGCVAALTRRLSHEPGVARTRVSLEESAAAVIYDPDVVTEARLKAIVAEAGFAVG